MALDMARWRDPNSYLALVWINCVVVIHISRN
jgi:hypothetical protein